MAERTSDLLEQTLREGETVLWTLGRASVPRLWNWVAYYLFAVCLCTFLSVSYVLAASLLKRDLTDGFVALLMLVPVGFVLRLAIKLLKRRTAFSYAVTDQRVMILNHISPISVLTFGAGDLTSLHRQEMNGSGRIYLKPAHFLWAFNFSQVFTPPVLFEVPDSKEIEALIYEELVLPYLSQTSVNGAA